MSEGWSDEELRASVAAYVDMQRQQRAGRRYTKKQYYAALADRYGRTEKAFEYRMQNISYVLSVMGRDWLVGLKPAKNVGANVAAKIERLLSEIEGTKSKPVVAFEVEVREGLSKRQTREPKGNPAPLATSAEVTQYQRDARVKAWLLQQAKGQCECCGRAAPFLGPGGMPYLEVHHVRQLADGGSDTVSNAVAVCPNCHRELHYGEKAKVRVDDLFARIPRLARE